MFLSNDASTHCVRAMSTTDCEPGAFMLLGKWFVGYHYVVEFSYVC